MDCGIGEVALVDRLAAHRVENVDQSHGERRTRPDPGAGRKITLMMDLDATFVVELHELQSCPDRRMQDLGNRVDGLDVRPDHPVTRGKEGGQVTPDDVAVPVDGHRQYVAAMFPIPFGIVRAAAEERHAVGRSRHCHRHVVACRRALHFWMLGSVLMAIASGSGCPRRRPAAASSREDRASSARREFPAASPCAARTSRCPGPGGRHRWDEAGRDRLPP